MGTRESFQKLIDRKQSEIARLEQELRDARIYIQAVQDSCKLLPKDVSSLAGEKELRPGTAIAQVQQFLKDRGAPQHISTILGFLEKPQDKKNRVSLSSSLGGYAKDGRIFTRPAPNTFGLIEFGVETQTTIDDLPDTFGQP